LFHFFFFVLEDRVLLLQDALADLLYHFYTIPFTSSHLSPLPRPPLLPFRAGPESLPLSLSPTPSVCSPAIAIYVGESSWMSCMPLTSETPASSSSPFPSEPLICRFPSITRAVACSTAAVASCCDPL
jgi:hypothetical protein